MDITRSNSGRITAIDDSGNRAIINPASVSRQQEYTYDSVETRSENVFKLVTLRKNTNSTLAQVVQQLENTQSNLEQAALFSGTSLYPIQIPQAGHSLEDFYSVYVDEDLYGLTPIYTFYAPTSNSKVFIDAKGVGKEEYVVHVIHYLNSVRNPEGTFNRTWRIVTIDSTENLKTYYVLESDDLPECFRSNYNIDNIHYLGGGSFTGYGVSYEDMIPVEGKIPRESDSYRRLTNNSSRGIIYKSFVPTYSFSWNRGTLENSYRFKDSKIEYDPDYYRTNGVLRENRSSQYQMDLYHRVEQENITPVIKQEYSTNTAEYLQSTNFPINSVFQSPDYGTDQIRFVLSRYTQETNITRVKESGYNLVLTRKAQKTISNQIPILASTFDSGYFISLDLGVGKGNISHGTEPKTTRGERGISHYYDYRYWWAYGKVISVDILENTNNIYFGENQTDESRVGSFVPDEGEIFISPEFPNAIETTWEEDPPMFYFTRRTGTLQFFVRYLNPPFIGHNGVYYYHDNPAGGNNFSLLEENIDLPSGQGYFGMANSFGNAGGTGSNELRTNQSIFNQLMGRFNGGFVPSLYIGNVNISTDTVSRVVMSPTQDQRGFLANNPSVFPNGFYNPYQSEIVTNENIITIYTYDIDGNLLSTVTL